MSSQSPFLKVTSVFFVVFLPFSYYTKCQVLLHSRSLIDIKIGEDLGDLKLTDLNSKPVDIAALRQNHDFVIMLFWATWCSTCRVELQELTKFQEAEKDKKVAIVAVSIDDDSVVVKKYLSSEPLPFPVVMDTDGILSKRYSLQGVPAGIVIDKQGKIVDRLSGFEQNFDKKLLEWTNK